MKPQTYLQYLRLMPILILLGSATGCQILRQWDPQTESFSEFKTRFASEVRDPSGASVERAVRVTNLSAMREGQVNRINKEEPLFRDVKPRNIERKQSGAIASRTASSEPEPWNVPQTELLDSQLPTAVRVRNNPNRVVSPYDNSKQVDVAGMTPGEVVLDPFSQRPFIIPPMP